MRKRITRTSESERLVRDIKRKTRKQYGAEEKIRIVLDGLRGDFPEVISALTAPYEIAISSCRHDQMLPSLLPKMLPNYRGKLQVAKSEYRKTVLAP